MINHLRELDRNLPGPTFDEQARSIYCERYAASYPGLYVSPWLRKHDLNKKNLERVLDGLIPPLPYWLDLACGQAWHFSVFPARARMLGVDISEAQLLRARARVPGAEFVCENMARVGFPSGSFDLVTSFWAGYCYLRSPVRIAALWRSAVDWIAPGGALYIEVLRAGDLESFNRSRFSIRTQFRVSARSQDFSEWEYEDIGGTHVMTSPPVEQFLEIISPHFRTVDARHDGAFMVHLIATGRR